MPSCGTMTRKGTITRGQGRRAWNSLPFATRKEVIALARQGKRTPDCEIQLKVNMYVSGLLKNWWKDEVVTTIVPLALAIAALGIFNRLEGLPNSYLSGAGLLLTIFVLQGYERGRVEQLAKIYGYFPDGASLPQLGHTRRFLLLPPRPWPVWWPFSAVVVVILLGIGTYFEYDGRRGNFVLGAGLTAVGAVIAIVSGIMLNRAQK